VQSGATANAFHGNYGCCGFKTAINVHPVDTIDLYIGGCTFGASVSGITL
jgi:hypothetical protein